MPIPFLSAILFAGVTVGQALLVVGSALYQRNQQRRLEGQLAGQRDAALGQDIRPSNSSSPIPIHYGFGETTGVRVFGSTNENFANHLLATSARGSMFGQIDNATGTKNEFAIVQDVIGFDGMDAIVGFEIDDQDNTSGIFTGYHRLNVYLDGGVADPLAFNNHEDIANTAVFEDLAYATGVYRLNREDPQYSGFPTVRYYYRGKRVWDPRQSSQSQSDPSTWSFTNNTALVLLDYLTNDNYGMNVSLTQIDLPGFITAANTADEVVQVGVAIGGRVFGTDTTRDVRRHEFNGTINSGRNHQQNLEEIIDTVPGGLLIYTATGRYKPVFPDATTASATQSVRTLTTRDITEEVSVTYPSTRDKLNQVTITYANASQDFAADTLTYPDRTTPSLTAQLDAYLVEDNNTQLITAIELPGVGGRYHAANAALATVAESRLKQYSFNVTSQHIDLEPGDIIRVQVPQQELDEFIRIASARVNRNNGTIDIVASEWDLDLSDANNPTGTFVWKTENNETITPREIFDFSVPAPVITSIAIEPGGAERINIQWEDGSDGEASIVEYIIEYMLITDTEFTVAGTTVHPISQFYFTPALPGSYDIRVIARTRDSRRSPSSNVRRVAWRSVAGTTLIERFHENLTTNDPGVPTGIDGTNGDWYDPDTDFGRNSARDPHWQATTFASPDGGAQEIVDFTVTGTGGTTTSTITQNSQEHNFTVSGVPGEEITLGPRPEQTEFTFAGQGANYDINNQPSNEVWQLDVLTGSSDAAASNISEEFFIYLTGSSGSDTTAFQQGTFAAPDLGSRLTFRLDFGTATTSAATDSSRQSMPSTGAAGYDIYGMPGITAGSYTAQQAADAMNTAGTFPDTSPSGLDVISVRAEGQYLLFEVQFKNLSTAGITFSSGSIPTSGFNDGFEGLSYQWGEDATQLSQVEITIPTESITETFSLTAGLTTDLALRNDLVTMLQANTNITDEFTVTLEMGDVGTQTNVPFIQLVANDTTDHTIGVTFSSAGGDLTGSEFGTITEGATGGVPTTVRIAYDAGLTPSFQDIVLGNAMDTTAIATVLTSMIDGHGQITATRLARIPAVFRTDLSDSVRDGSIASFSMTGPTTGTPGAWEASFSAARTAFGFATAPANTTVGAVIRWSGDIATTTDWAVYRAATSSLSGRLNLFLTASSGSQRSTVSRFSTTSGDTTQQVIATPAIERVQITSNVFANFDQPTITVTTPGSTSEVPTFSISTITEGGIAVSGAGFPTTYSVMRGSTLIGFGSFAPGESPSTAIQEIDSAIPSDYITVVNGNVLTISTPIGTSGDVTILITAGINETGGTSTNDLRASRRLVQSGLSIAMVSGQDATVMVLSGTTILGTVNGGGMTTAQIADAIRVIYNDSAAWNASGLTDSTFTITSNHIGTTPTPSLMVDPGSTSDSEFNLTNGTLAVSQIVVEDGETITIAGAATVLTITTGADTDVITLASSSNAEDTSEAIVQAINTSVPDYNASRNANIVRTTSLERTDEDDITITITTAGTGGTVAIARVLVQQGASPGFDLTGASWRYGIFNQENRVGAGLTMTDDNTIMVNGDGTSVIINPDGTVSAIGDTTQNHVTTISGGWVDMSVGTSGINQGGFVTPFSYLGGADDHVAALRIQLSSLGITNVTGIEVTGLNLGDLVEPSDANPPFRLGMAYRVSSSPTQLFPNINPTVQPLEGIATGTGTGNTLDGGTHDTGGLVFPAPPGEENGDFLFFMISNSQGVTTPLLQYMIEADATAEIIIHSNQAAAPTATASFTPYFV